jgi:hypothetical protein
MDFFVVCQKNILSSYNYVKNINDVGNGSAKVAETNNIWLVQYFVDRTELFIYKNAHTAYENQVLEAVLFIPAGMKHCMVIRFIVSAARTQYPTLFCVAMRYNIVTRRQKLEEWNEKGGSILGRGMINTFLRQQIQTQQ